MMTDASADQEREPATAPAAGTPAASTPAVAPSSVDSSSVTPGMHFYVLRVASNREERVREALDRKIKIEGLDDRVARILVPARSRNESGRSIATEQIKIHGLGIDGGVKAVLADFGGVRQDIVVGREHEIPIRPERHAIIGGRVEVVLLNDAVPNRSLVGHELGEHQISGRRGRHVEQIGQLRPEISPPVAIAVGDVEDLVGAALGGRHPDDGFGQMRGPDAFGERAVGLGPAREDERPAERTHDRPKGGDQ